MSTGSPPPPVDGMPAPAVTPQPKRQRRSDDVAVAVAVASTSAEPCDGLVALPRPLLMSMCLNLRSVDLAALEASCRLFRELSEGVVRLQFRMLYAPPPLDARRGGHRDAGAAADGCSPGAGAGASSAGAGAGASSAGAGASSAGAGAGASSAGAGASSASAGASSAGAGASGAGASGAGASSASSASSADARPSNAGARASTGASSPSSTPAVKGVTSEVPRPRPGESWPRVLRFIEGIANMHQKRRRWGRGRCAASAGVAHSLFVSVRGEAYSFGLGFGGRLGHNNELKYAVPRRIAALRDVVIVQAAAGSGSSVFVAADGRLFTCGRNQLGQLGLGDTTERLVPTLVAALHGKHCIHASMGDSYTMAVTDDGAAFSWGQNLHGVLGHGDALCRTLPHRITALAPHVCVQVSAGRFHALFLTRQGVLLACGSGKAGRLGLGTASDHSVPTVVKALRGVRVIQVAAGTDHSMALSDSGLLWTFGFGTFGALGLVRPTDIDALLPQRVQNPHRFVQVSAGEMYSIALCDTGQVYTWGWGRAGQLGHGDDRNVPRPRRVEGLRGVQAAHVSAGSGHSIVLASVKTLAEGAAAHTIYTFGYGDSGRLGHQGSGTTPLPVTEFDEGVA